MKTTRTSFAVVTAHFYPAPDARLEGQYIVFRRQFIERGIPLITLAVGEDYRAWQTRYPEVDVLAGDIAFHKERLWTIGAERAFEAGATHVLCLDADVIFLSPGWEHQIADALAGNDVVHPFELFYHRFDDTGFWCRSVLGQQVIVDGSARRRTLAHRMTAACWSIIMHRLRIGRAPGFGVAFSRKFLDSLGFYQFAIVGSGDTLLWDTLLRLVSVSNPGRRSTALERRLDLAGFPPNRALRDDIARWLERGHAHISQSDGLRISFARGVHATAMPYGRLVRRSYIERQELLARFDPKHDVVHDRDSGIIFAPHAQSLRTDVADYLLTRNDDAS